MPASLDALQGNLLRFLQVDDIVIFDIPEEIPLRHGPHITAVPVDDGNRAVAVMLHLFQGLAERIVFIKVSHFAFRCYKKQYIHSYASFFYVITRLVPCFALSQSVISIIQKPPKHVNKFGHFNQNFTEYLKKYGFLPGLFG